MKIIVIANQKGGVGKTTFGRHLYFAAKEHKLRTLVVDFDPQANTSKTLFHIHGETAPDQEWLKASDLFTKHSKLKPLQVDELSGLVSADNKLVDASEFSQEVVLQARKTLQTFGDQYDVCIIDTPPSKGQLLFAALSCADYVLSPCTLDEDATDGLAGLFEDIQRVRQAKWNPTLKILGIQVNEMNKSRAYDRQALKDLQTQCKGMVLPNIVYERAAIKLAIRKPVWRSARGGMNKSLAAVEMKTACDAVLHKIGLGA